MRGVARDEVIIASFKFIALEGVAVLIGVIIGRDVLEVDFDFEGLAFARSAALLVMFVTLCCFTVLLFPAASSARK